MSKMSTDLTRHALNGATMGTRWSALFFEAPEVDPDLITRACQAAVDEIDDQMSTWKPDSDLMRLNGAPVGDWVPLPQHLLAVLGLGLDIGGASEGAFDITLGDAVSAWGFGPKPATEQGIRAAMARQTRPAWETLEIDPAHGRARKHADIQVDLNAIAKGYGVDRLAETLTQLGVSAALVGIDGDLRAMGTRPDAEPWTVAIETPDTQRRAAHSILALEDGAVATSGDYRHWVEVQGRRLSHTMDPKRPAPLAGAPASVTVVARTCAEADAWATAYMVMGVERGAAQARADNKSVLFLEHDGAEGVKAHGVGPLFAP